MRWQPIFYFSKIIQFKKLLRSPSNYEKSIIQLSSAFMEITDWLNWPFWTFIFRCFRSVNKMSRRVTAVTIGVIVRRCSSEWRQWNLFWGAIGVQSTLPSAASAVVKTPVPQHLFHIGCSWVSLAALDLYIPISLMNPYNVWEPV